MSIKSRFSLNEIAFNSGAPNGELASSKPVMAANIITTAAFLSDFIVPKYSDFGNKEFTP
jgi:hypothetical protein